MTTLALLAYTAGALAITGARVEVGDGGVIESATVVVDGGRIVAVGPAVPVPNGAVRIDGAGKVLTPGLVAAGAQTGLVEVALEDGTVDAHVDGQAVPAFRALDGFNPLSPHVAIDRAEGVTTAVLTPTGALLFGQGYTVPLTGTLASTSQARRAAMFGGWSKDSAGGSRGGVLLRLREIFDDVRFYKANKGAYDRAGARALTLPRVHLEALIDVVDGKLPLVFDVNRAADIQALLRFADEQHLRVMVNGGAEAWMIAADLARAQVPVILQPSSMEPWGFDALHARDDDATLLAKAGVTVVLSSSGLGTTRLRQEAGVAVSYGLSHEAALTAITQTPARLFGADDVGTVAVGKRADLVLWSGDPFETSTSAELVLIAGERMDLDTRQRQLVQKYRH